MSDSPLTADDLDLIKVVADDLEFLEDAWTMETTSAALRRESPVLRRLLIQDDYGRAWRLVGLPGEPMVRAGDLRAWVAGVPPRYIVSAMAPLPATWEGEFQVQAGFGDHVEEGDLLLLTSMSRPVLSHAMVIVPKDEVEGDDPEEFGKKVMQDASRLKHEYYTLSKFLDSPALIVQGERFTRRDIIQFVANRRGGAHHGRLDARFDRLDNYPDKARDIEFPFLQLLAIGQVLADSSDAHRFRTIAAKKLRQARGE